LLRVVLVRQITGAAFDLIRLRALTESRGDAQYQKQSNADPSFHACASQ
jgi:hypothetical protein